MKTTRYLIIIVNLLCTFSALAKETGEEWIALSQQIMPEVKIKEELLSCGIKLHKKKVFCPSGIYTANSSPIIEWDFSPAPIISLAFSHAKNNYLLISLLTPEGVGPTWIFQTNGPSVTVTGKGRPLAFIPNPPQDIKNWVEKEKLEKSFQAMKNDFLAIKKKKGKKNLGLGEMLTLTVMEELWNSEELDSIQKQYSVQGGLAKALWQEEVINRTSWQSEEQSLRSLGSSNILTYLTSYYRLWKRDLSFKRVGRLAAGLGSSVQALDSLLTLADHHKSEFYTQILLALSADLDQSYRLMPLQKIISIDTSEEVTNLILKSALYGSESLSKQSIILLAERHITDDHGHLFLKWLEKMLPGSEERAQTILELSNFSSNTSVWVQRARLKLANGQTQKTINLAMNQLKKNPPDDSLADYWEKNLGTGPTKEALSLVFLFPLTTQLSTISRYINHSKTPLREVLVEGMANGDKEKYRQYIFALMFDQVVKIREIAVNAMLDMELTKDDFKKAVQLLSNSKAKNLSLSIKPGETLLRSLEKIEGQDKLPYLLLFIRHGDSEQKKVASLQMAPLDGDDVRTTLIELLTDQSEDVRLNAHMILTQRTLTEEQYQRLRRMVDLRSELGMDLIIDLLAKDNTDSSRKLIEKVAKEHKSSVLRKKAEDELLYQSL